MKPKSKISDVIKRVTGHDSEVTERTTPVTTITLASDDATSTLRGLAKVNDHLADETGKTLTEKPTNKYAFIRTIGQGGMKSIIEVRDKDTARTVAMALLLNPDKKELYNRFIREARITANLEHPNIVPIHDIGVNEDGTPYFTMKFLRGETLQSIIQKLKDRNPEYVQKWTLSRLLLLFRKICNGIGFAHSNNVVHLDLCPENVQVGRFGEVLVLDWGLANVIDDPESVEEEFDTLVLDTTILEQQQAEREHDLTGMLTLDGDIKGTPGYMAPEQAAGKNRERDVRTDIYALGAILYSILTYESPVQTGHVKKMIEDTIDGKIVPIRKRLANRHIPSALVAVTLKAMHVDPNKRYQTVREMRKDIDAFISGFSTQAERAGIMTELILFLKRHKMTVTLLTVILALIMTLSAFFIREKRSQQSGWKHVYKQNFTEEAFSKDDFVFTNLAMTQVFTNNLVNQDGFSLWRAGWIWLKDTKIYGDIRLEISVSSTDPNSNVQIAFNSHEQKLAKYWLKPRGYTYQFGGFNGEDNILFKNNVSMKVDLTQSILPALNDGTQHTIVIERSEHEVKISVDGRESISVRDMFPPIEKRLSRVGLRFSSPKIKLHQLKVSRLRLPELSSPLISAEALAENRFFKQAVEKYLTIAENYEGTHVGSEALARAYITAATKLSGDNSRLLRNIKYNINVNSTDFKFNDKILSVDILLAWKRGNFAKAFNLLKNIESETLKQTVVEEVLQLKHQELPPHSGIKFLKLLSKLEAMPQLDISNYGLSDLSILKNNDFDRLDCSNNNISDLSALKGKSLKFLDCSRNQIHTLDTMKDVRVHELICSSNNIIDVSPLANKTITYLDLSHNMISDASPLLEIKGLKTLIISHKTPNVEVLKEHPTLELITANAGLLELEDTSNRFWMIVEKYNNLKQK